MPAGEDSPRQNGARLQDQTGQMKLQGEERQSCLARPQGKPRTGHGRMVRSDLVGRWCGRARDMGQRVLGKVRAWPAAPNPALKGTRPFGLECGHGQDHTSPSPVAS